MGLISRVSSRTYRRPTNSKRSKTKMKDPLEMVTDFLYGIYESLGKKYYMDYKGQELSEQLSWVICSIFTVIGVIYGYAIQNLSMSIYITLVGIVVAFLLTIFPINPLYQRNPIKWQKPKKRD